ncbi:MAG: hypothetical protein AAFZ63_27745, partial [Bacteroidota bacterium]
QQITSEAPYVQATTNYENCRNEKASIQNQIDKYRQELALIVATNPKYRIMIQTYIDSTGKVRREEPPAGEVWEKGALEPKLSRIGRDERRRINDRIAQARQRIPSCDGYLQERKEYTDGRKIEIAEQKTQLKDRRSLAINKESEIIADLDTLKSENDAKVEKAGTDIFGKLIALENAKTQMTATIDSTAVGTLNTNLKTEQSMMYYISWSIMIFFFILETCPVIVKIMADRGPYDEILETQEITIREEQRLKQSERLDETRNELELRREAQEHARSSELDTNDELMRQISSARIDIAKQVVEKWKEKELQALATNPEEYLEKSIK